MNASLWTYATSERIANDEDAYFAHHPLLKADRALLDARFDSPGPLIDLGCGSGRLTLHFARRGFAVTGVELSQPLLETVASKADAQGTRIDLVRGNLCGLGCFPSKSFAYALMMFSTLGMIRGAVQRQRAVEEACRILRPGGTFAIHVHNLYLNLYDPQGRSWLVGQLWKAASGHGSFGDRRMSYRGITGMEVHLYRWREFRRSLRGAGFLIEEVVPIDAITAEKIPLPWLWHGIRAGGWIVFARRGS